MSGLRRRAAVCLLALAAGYVTLPALHVLVHVLEAIPQQHERGRHQTAAKAAPDAHRHAGGLVHRHGAEHDDGDAPGRRHHHPGDRPGHHGDGAPEHLDAVVHAAPAIALPRPVDRLAAVALAPDPDDFAGHPALVSIHSRGPPPAARA